MQFTEEHPDPKLFFFLSQGLTTSKVTSLLIWMKIPTPTTVTTMKMTSPHLLHQETHRLEWRITTVHVQPQEVQIFCILVLESRSCQSRSQSLNLPAHAACQRPFSHAGLQQDPALNANILSQTAQQSPY